jgi:hypothetical protein
LQIYDEKTKGDVRTNLIRSSSDRSDQPIRMVLLIRARIHG